MLNENGQLIFAVLISLALPVILIAARVWRERKAIVVTVLITKIEEIHRDEDTYFYPTFEVASGFHKGIKYRSNWDCGASGYKVGDYIQANLFPSTGEIYGNKRTHREWLIWFIPFFGILAFIIAKEMKSFFKSIDFIIGSLS